MIEDYMEKESYLLEGLHKDWAPSFEDLKHLLRSDPAIHHIEFSEDRGRKVVSTFYGRRIREELDRQGFIETREGVFEYRNPEEGRTEI